MKKGEGEEEPSVRSLVQRKMSAAGNIVCERFQR